MIKRNITFIYNIFFVYFLYLNWLLVLSSIHKTFLLCRRYICSKQGSRRIILCILITGCVVVIYKPVLSGVYLSHDGIQYCTASKDHNFVSFLLDSLFALLITFIPFMIISVLNVLIMRKLCMRNSKFQGILYITRTIFYMNYSVNFFLYSISGRSFRRELTNLFTCKRTMLPFRSSRLSPTHQSWV